MEIKTEGLPKVAICVASGGSLPAVFVRQLIELINYTTFQNIAKVGYYDYIGPEVSICREELTKDVMKNTDYEYILWIDPDTKFPKETIQVLLALKKDFIGGVVFGRYSPFFPNIRHLSADKIYHRIFVWDGNLFPVDGIGFGLVLIHRKVIEQIEEPRFQYVGELGEDMYFCKKAKDKGIGIWATTALNLIHGQGWDGAGEEDWNRVRDSVMDELKVFRVKPEEKVNIDLNLK
jgi:hypothetical protein